MSSRNDFGHDDSTTNITVVIIIIYHKQDMEAHTHRFNGPLYRTTRFQGNATNSLRQQTDLPINTDCKLQQNTLSRITMKYKHIYQSNSLVKKPSYTQVTETAIVCVHTLKTA